MLGVADRKKVVAVEEVPAVVSEPMGLTENVTAKVSSYRELPAHTRKSQDVE